MNAELSPELLEIDGLLRSAARNFAYPPTPQMAARVSARLRGELGAERAPLLGRLWGTLPLRAGAGAAIALLLAVGVSVAVPQSRDALADFFGLSHVRVEIGPAVGPTPPVLSPESFAEPSTVEGARAVVDFPLRFLERDGVRFYPSEVYLQGESPDLPVVIFVYDDFDLYQTRLSFFGKGGPDPSLIHEIELDGLPALWIDEGGHIAQFYDEQGRLVIESRRTVNRATLLWEQDGITYRLETSLSQDEAIEVARSLR